MVVTITPQLSTRVIMLLAGLYSWEILITLDIELDLVFQRKRFRWPTFFYLANRYSYFGSLLSAAVLNGSSVYQALDCQRLFMSALIFASLAMGLSSTNLAIRTVAIWNRNIFVTSGLCLMLSIHWLLMVFHQRIVRADFEMGMGCVVKEQGYHFILGLLSHCLIFDAIVLALNGWRLAKGARLLTHICRRATRRTVPLTEVVLLQGLTYFIVACFCHVVTIVLMALSPDLGGLVLLGDEALISIIACRAVRALHNDSSISEIASTPSGPSPGPWLARAPTDFNHTPTTILGKQRHDLSIAPTFQTEMVVQVECVDDQNIRRPL